MERRVQPRQRAQVGLRENERGLARSPGSLDRAAAHDGHWLPRGGLPVGGGDDLQQSPLIVGQEHADAVEAKRLLGAVDEGLHSLPDIHRAHHAHGQRVEVLAHPAAVLDILEQSRLGEGHRRVLGESLHDLGLARRDGPVGSREEAHDPNRTPRHQQRQHHRREHARVDETRGDGGIGSMGRARRQVLDDDRAARGRHLAHEPLTQRELQRRPVSLALVVRAGALTQPLTLERPEPAGPTRKEGKRGIDHRGQDGLGVERGREGAAEPGQRLQTLGIE